MVELEEQKLTVCFDALKRTDSYILALDQKASFTLAAGITFLGNYASLFYGMISSDTNKAGPELLVSAIGISLVLWILWFFKIKDIFHPNTKSSKVFSIVSFASITNSFENYDQFYKHFNTVDNISKLHEDILENHWLCAKICMDKVTNFKASLNYLLAATSTSILSLSLVAAYNTFI